MIYSVVAVLELACVLVTVAPLRAGAACTPATHRARQAFGALCGACALFGFGRFVYFVLMLGHPLGANVVVGQTVSALFAVQAVVLLRGALLRPGVAIPLALAHAGLGLAAVVRALS